MTYVLADATGLAERELQGQISLNVRGRPGAPTSISADASNAQVEVDWIGAEPNGAPITGYRLTWTSSCGFSGETTIQFARSTHTVPCLTNAVSYRFLFF